MLKQHSAKEFHGLFCNRRFYILSLTNILSQMSPVHINLLHFSIAYCFLSFRLRAYLPNGIILHIFSVKICMHSSSMHVRCFVTTHS
jgi:hypothetical protein